jgi:hypothetical protein
MKKTTFIAFSISILLLVAFGSIVPTTEKTNFQLITKTKLFVASKPVSLEFKSNTTTAIPKLFVIHSYGKTLIEGEINMGKIKYSLPDLYTKKSGTVSWFLLDKSGKKTEGYFEIIPNEKTKTQIENYLGPRSILAGGKEYTMMVCVPTDLWDNPVPENTKVLVKSQFLNTIVVTPKKTKDFIAWKNIYSPNKSGKLVVATETNFVATKEIETEVYSNIPTDFRIDYKRNHVFADGNQITTLFTSILKDQYGNVVSDGTLVTFCVITQNNLVLKTFGTTLNGIAKGQILHPDHQERFKIKAYVTGMAESNSISIEYKPLIASFSYAFTNNNRTLTVGPLKSFMGQLVPDGIKVVVKVLHNNRLVSIIQEDTAKGIAAFTFAADNYKEKNYRFEITTLGITQQTETKHYGSN